jgi:putative heme transporter
MSTADETTGGPSFRWRTVVLQALVVAGLLALVAFAISQAVPGSGARLRHSDSSWLALALGLEAFALGSYAVLFHTIFSGGRYRIPRVRSAQIGIGELAGFVVTPTGAGGPAIRIWALLRGGMPFRVVMTRTVTHAVVYNLPYVLAAVLLGAGALLHVGEGHAHTALALAPFGVIFLGIAFALWAVRLGRRPARGSGRWQRIGRDVIEAVPDGLRETPPRLRQRYPLPSAIGYWAGDCGVLIVAVHAVHGSAPIAVIVLAYMLGQLGNIAPLPGGVGGVEPAMLGVLTSSGVDPALGAAAVVVYRFISLGFQAVAGAIAVGTLIPSLQRERTG